MLCSVVKSYLWVVQKVFKPPPTTLPVMKGIQKGLCLRCKKLFERDVETDLAEIPRVFFFNCNQHKGVN